MKDAEEDELSIPEGSPTDEEFEGSEMERDDLGPLEAEAELSARQEALIAALLSEPTQEAAADRAEVPRSTMYRWLREVTFAARYRDARRDLFTHQMGRLQKTTGIALDTLREVMEDPANPAAARVTAAKAILDLARQNIETADFEERLTALEEMQR